MELKFKKETKKRKNRHESISMELESLIDNRHEATLAPDGLGKAGPRLMDHIITFACACVYM